LSIPPTHATLSGEFYGQGCTVANLELVARFFEKYPEYADRAFLSVKGGCVPGKLDVDGSRENLRRSVDNIIKTLNGKKRLDLFQPARRDPNYEIEHYAEVLNELHKERKFDTSGFLKSGRRLYAVRTRYETFFLPGHPCARECLLYESGYVCCCGRDRSKPSII
jgi:aryl-alcohol dehydrogenase-like predicted oxidoreductase